MIKGFIFDLDGVITDTAELHFMAWKTLADAQGWQFTRDVNEKLRGISRIDSIKIILDHNHLVLDDAEMMASGQPKKRHLC